MIKLINNVLTLQDGFDLYNGLINQNFWQLTRASSGEKPGGTFPGVTLIEENEIIHNNPYWIGYFNCLFDTVPGDWLLDHTGGSGVDQPGACSNKRSGIVNSPGTAGVH